MDLLKIYKINKNLRFNFTKNSFENEYLVVKQNELKVKFLFLYDYPLLYDYENTK